MSAPASILVVQLRQVGDVILAGPLVRALKEAWPEARVDFLVEDYAAAAAEGIPWVDRVRVIPRRPGAGGLWRLRRELRAARFDVAIDAQGNQKTGLYTMLSGARRRVGFAHPWYKPYFRWFYTDRVARDPSPRFAPRYKMDLLRPLGIEPACPVPGFVTTPEADVVAGELLAGWGLAGEDPVIGMGPGGRVDWKNWPLDRYVELGRRQLARGRRVLVLRGPGEDAIAGALQEALGEGAVVERAPGYAVHAAVLARLDAVVVNDGGNVHLAAGVGTPAVCLFGPTDPRHWAPPPPARVAVVSRPCDCAVAAACGPPQRCLAEIPVDEVEAALEALLAGDPVEV